MSIMCWSLSNTPSSHVKKDSKNLTSKIIVLDLKKMNTKTICNLLLHNFNKKILPKLMLPKSMKIRSLRIFWGRFRKWVRLWKRMSRIYQIRSQNMSQWRDNLTFTSTLIKNNSFYKKNWGGIWDCRGKWRRGGRRAVLSPKKTKNLTE